MKKRGTKEKGIEEMMVGNIEQHTGERKINIKKKKEGKKVGRKKHFEGLLSYFYTLCKFTTLYIFTLEVGTTMITSLYMGNLRLRSLRKFSKFTNLVSSRADIHYTK